jgi:hypothetical protein
MNTDKKSFVFQSFVLFVFIRVQPWLKLFFPCLPGEC